MRERRKRKRRLIGRNDLCEPGSWTPNVNDVGEAEELLRLAGMAFSPNSPDDLVVKFCLENGIRDIPGVNYMLYRYANRTLEERRSRD